MVWSLVMLYQPWRLDIVCTSPYSAYSATSPPWGLEDNCPLGLGIQGWSHLSSLPPQRTQCNSMQGYMGCQVTGLNPGSSAPTGLIPLERDVLTWPGIHYPLDQKCLGTATSTSPSSHRVLPFCRPFSTWVDGRWWPHLHQWRWRWWRWWSHAAGPPKSNEETEALQCSWAWVTWAG